MNLSLKSSHLIEVLTEDQMDYIVMELQLLETLLGARIYWGGGTVGTGRDNGIGRTLLFLLRILSGLRVNQMMASEQIILYFGQPMDITGQMSPTTAEIIT